MLNGLTSKLLGGALALSLATAGAVSGYKYKKKVDFEKFFEATRTYVEASDHFRLNPNSKVSELADFTARYNLRKLMDKQGADDLGIHLMWGDVTYFKYEEEGIKHFYAGKMKRMDQIGDTTVYITKLKDEGFEGFSIPSKNGNGQEIISMMRKGKKGGVVNIDLYTLKRHAELRNHIKKGWQLPKNMLESTLRHELTHTEEGGNEIDAYGVQMEYCNQNGGCPSLVKDLQFLSSLKNPKGSEKEYHDSAINVLKAYQNVKSVPEYAEKLKRIEKKIKEGKRLY